MTKTRPMSLDSIRRSLEGVVTSVLCTHDGNGMPNVSVISQVHYVDECHVALSYQFFNKTRRNLLATRQACVEVADPITNAQHRLTLEFIETQSEGPVFEAMKAKLAGIASHSGMSSVFRLLGADIFRVRTIEPLLRLTLPDVVQPRDKLSLVRQLSRKLKCCADMTELIDVALDGLVQLFGIDHCMALLLDKDAGRFFTLASRGYARAGIGSEILLGEGIIGVAARERTPIRINHMTAEYRYGAAIREAVIQSGITWEAATEIPFPGLASPSSQLAIPVLAGGKVFGILFAESDRPMQFWHDDEDALVVISDVLGACILALPGGDARDLGPVDPPSPPDKIQELVVRHFERDDSVFLNHDYLIKGVAGAILCRLLRNHAETGRVEFSTRELRLDTSLRLPEFAENLDARLVLLRNRLEERASPIRIQKAGRGKLRLCIAGAVRLETSP